jgi:hypothetical protein
MTPIAQPSALTHSELRFHACIIRTEGFATQTDGDFFDGEVQFDLVVDGDVHRGLVARVKQAAGSRFADPLEVLPPNRWIGHFDYARYRDCVERYVREQVMSEVGDHRMSNANMRVRDVRIPAERSCTLVQAS